MNFHHARKLLSRARSALARNGAEFVEISTADLCDLEAFRAGQPLQARPDERQEVNLPRPRTINIQRQKLWALVDAVEAIPGVIDTAPVDYLKPEGV